MRAIPAFAVLASVALAEALPPFVVLSKARSGTTWFLELLRQHPQVRVEGEILLGASTSAEATARLEAFGREKRRGAAHVAVGFKLLDGQGGEALRDGAGNGTVAAWLERRRAKLLVLEREGLARLVSMRKHEAAVRDFDALLAAGALHSKNEKYKCFSADCVDRARARAVTLDASRVVRDLDREYDAWTQLLAWVRRYTSRTCSTVPNSTAGLGGPDQTSEFSSSAKSNSIRLIFGRINCSRRVLEANPKRLRRNGRVLSH